jgi:hypothetical protein
MLITEFAVAIDFQKETSILRSVSVIRFTARNRFHKAEMNKSQKPN